MSLLWLEAEPQKGFAGEVSGGCVFGAGSDEGCFSRSQLLSDFLNMNAGSVFDSGGTGGHGGLWPQPDNTARAQTSRVTKSANVVGNGDLLKPLERGIPRKTDIFHYLLLSLVIQPGRLFGVLLCLLGLATILGVVDDLGLPGPPKREAGGEQNGDDVFADHTAPSSA